MTAVQDLPPYRPELVARYLESDAWAGRNIGDELRAVARWRADRPALVTPEGRWTYRELDARTDAFAAGLLARTRLRPGDRVMFQMGNVAETVIAYYGVVKAGIVPVCTLPQHREREIRLLAEHTGARGHIVQADFGAGELTDFAMRLQKDCDVLDVLIVARGPVPAGAVGHDELTATGPGAPDVAIDPADLAVFQLSGGTTGLPKVAPRRHQEYVYNSRAWAAALGLHQDSVVLHSMPIIHNAGIVAALQPAHLFGATFALASSADPDAILDMVESARVTSMPVVVPAAVIRLLDHPRTRTADLSSLEQLYVGGQKLQPDVAMRIESELGVPCRQMFGMAEGMFLYTPPNAPEWVHLHTVGTTICAGDEVRVNEIGAGYEVADGELGELCCRGPYTIPGYYRALEHNAATFTSDGFYRTGDLACRHVIDGVAYYSIEGRIKDVINRGAEKIHAEEVEEVVARHPDVHDVALVAMPDPTLGERPCAYLVLEPGVTAPTVAELGEFLLGEGLAKYKLPERVEIVETFPLTNVGKVSKKDLRADVAAKLAAEDAVSVTSND